MKSTFKIGNLSFGDIQVNDIEFTQEYTAQEAVNLLFNGKEFVKELLKDMPVMLDDCDVIAEKAMELDKKYSTSMHNTGSEMMDSVMSKLKEMGIDPEYIKIITRG
ncbi:hypothetical protein [Paraclostridium dentum]|uniref:hypothetical protein n=1 Tax=Paraclostridium dentum TaxID=2662455 RepID=UPI003F3B03A7